MFNKHRTESARFSLPVDRYDTDEHRHYFRYMLSVALLSLSSPPIVPLFEFMDGNFKLFLFLLIDTMQMSIFIYQ